MPLNHETRETVTEIFIVDCVLDLIIFCLTRYFAFVAMSTLDFDLQ